jgi:hypothetical protein
MSDRAGLWLVAIIFWIGVIGAILLATYQAR